MDKTISLLRLPDVMARTGLGRAQIYRGVTRGSFPDRVKIGSRAVGWPSDRVDEWIADRIARADAVAGHKPAKT